jgi:hypothetical protein
MYIYKYSFLYRILLTNFAFIISEVNSKSEHGRRPNPWNAQQQIRYVKLKIAVPYICINLSRVSAFECTRLWRSHFRTPSSNKALHVPWGLKAPLIQNLKWKQALLIPARLSFVAGAFNSPLISFMTFDAGDFALSSWKRIFTYKIVQTSRRSEEKLHNRLEINQRL